MPINTYFDTLFAVSGDKTTVPDPTQGGGTVSYEQGYGNLYSTPVAEGGLNFPRAQHNQVLYDLTAAIQYIQQHGAPPFITSAMNGGSAYSYIKGAIVAYNPGSGLICWISAIAANTSIPGADANWLALPNTLVNVLFTGGTSGGSANAQTVTSSQGSFTNTAGHIVTWKAGFTNTSATTLTVDGGSPINLKKTTAAGVVALVSGDVVANGEYLAISDGTSLILNNPTTTPVTGRTVLSGNTTYYVATTGNDSNPGTIGSPWLTIQHAYDYIADNIDMAGFVASISVGSGTYAAGLAATVPTTGGTIQLTGDNTTPSNVIISSGANPCLAAYTGCVINISGFKVTNSSYQVMARGTGACITLNGNMEYGSGGGALLGQINAFWNGFVEVTADYTISGGAGQHYYCAGNGTIRVSSITVTVSGTPAYAGEFARASANAALQAYPITFSGSATGTRYLAANNGTIDTNGGGANYFPGNGAGSTNTGGQYV